MRGCAGTASDAVVHHDLVDVEVAYLDERREHHQHGYDRGNERSVYRDLQRRLVQAITTLARCTLPTFVAPETFLSHGEKGRTSSRAYAQMIRAIAACIAPAQEM